MHEVALDAHQRDIVGLQVKVTRVMGDDAAEEIINVSQHRVFVLSVPKGTIPAEFLSIPAYTFLNFEGK